MVLPNQSLPQELVDVIIDQFHDDGATLLKCSLISRACCERSRHHIFRDIYITVTNLRDTIPTFISLLDPSRGISSSIQKLYITGYGPGIRKLDVGLVSRILGSLTCLRDLSLVDILFKPQAGHVRLPFRSFRLSRLYIHDTRAELPTHPRTHHPIYELFSLFSEVDDLTLFGEHTSLQMGSSGRVTGLVPRGVYAEPLGVEGTPADRMRVNTLNILELKTPVDWALVFRSHCLRSLTVELNFRKISGLREVGHLLRICSRSVISLFLRINSHRGLDHGTQLSQF